MKTKRLILAAAAMTLAISCKPQYDGDDAFLVEPLKDILAPIKVGAAIDGNTLRNEQNMKLFSHHFNSATCENSMKPIETERTQGVLTFDTPDRVVDFVLGNDGAVMRGHCLIWHSQCPAWLTEDSTQVFKRMKEHIFAVMNHYKGKVYCYDVVNEAIDDGRGFLRNSQWLRVAGEHFIDSAFVYAHQADPDALLFYNDYGLNNPAKREKCYQLVKGMLDRGIPIHGIGMQGHYNVNMDYNTVEEWLKEGVNPKELFDNGHRVKYFLDADLKKAERVSFHPCENTASVVVSNAGFMRFLEIWGGEVEWIEVQ